MGMLVLTVNLFQIGYVFMNTSGKHLQTKPVSSIDMFEFTWFRSFVLTAFSAIILCAGGRPISVQKSFRRPLIARCVVGTFTFLLACISMQTIPVSWILLLNNTQPFFVAIFQVIFLQISVSRFDIFAMIGAYTGVLILGLASMKR